MVQRFGFNVRGSVGRAGIDYTSGRSRFTVAPNLEP